MGKPNEVVYIMSVPRRPQTASRYYSPSFPAKTSLNMYRSPAISRTCADMRFAGNMHYDPFARTAGDMRFDPFARTAGEMHFDPRTSGEMHFDPRTSGEMHFDPHTSGDMHYDPFARTAGNMMQQQHYNAFPKTASEMAMRNGLAFPRTSAPHRHHNKYAGWGAECGDN